MKIILKKQLVRIIFEEGALEGNSVCREFRRTGKDGKGYLVKHYNLDVVISVGYRVKSQRGTQFRIWVTQRLKVIVQSLRWICKTGQGYQPFCHTFK